MKILHVVAVVRASNGMTLEGADDTKAGRCACGVRARTRVVVQCIPLICREFRAQPNFSPSCAGTDWTEANFGVA